MERTQIEDAAAAWLARRDTGHWSGADAGALQAWLDASTANRVAFLRLEAAWEESPRLKALAAGLPQGAGPASDWRLRMSKKGSGVTPQTPEHSTGTDRARGAGARRNRYLALAASLLAAVGVAYYFAGDRLRGERYATPVGGTASVPLQDGTTITLNTASTIRVELNAQERRVDLARGEAFFDVAKDPARPFVVTAGNKQITAVGTAFSVKRDGNDVRVIVTEGKVAITGGGAARETQADAVELSAGAVARTSDSGFLVQKKTLAETSDLISWRTGYLTFRDTPLAEAITEFNQYNKERLTVDPGVANIPLTGKFKATNYEAFIRLLEDGYSIKAERNGNDITLATR